MTLVSKCNGKQWLKMASQGKRQKMTKTMEHDGNQWNMMEKSGK